MKSQARLHGDPRHHADDIAKLKAENEALRAAIRRYGKHSHKCRMQPWFDTEDQWCSCGLEELLRSAHPALP